MNFKKLFFKADKTGFVLGAALLGTLTGCVTHVHEQRAERVYVREPRAERVYVAPPPPVETVVVVQDDFVYYPHYQVYYSSSRHQCIYLEGRSWVARPAPPRISIDVLFASPSVRVDFHDSPAHHHTEIVRQYPRNWTPPGSDRGRKDDRKDDRRDERGENNGR